MPDPEIFYSYQQKDDPAREQGLFVNDTLWFSTPDLFNDPFEARPVIRSDPNFAPSRRELKNILAKQMEGASRNERRLAIKEREKAFCDPAVRRDRSELTKKKFAELFQTTSIACLSSCSTDIRMWSHYASKHAGYCVGFDFDTAPWIWSPKGRREDLALWPMAVRYQATYPIVDADASFDTAEERTQLIDNSILTKAEEWRSEKEWRCVRVGEPAGPQRFPKGAIVQVIFGARIDPDYRAKLITLLQARRLPITLLQARTAVDRFELLLDPVAGVF